MKTIWFSTKFESMPTPPSCMGELGEPLQLLFFLDHAPDQHILHRLLSFLFFDEILHLRLLKYSWHTHHE
jgi:hypothetical protein